MTEDNVFEIADFKDSEKLATPFRKFYNGQVVRNVMDPNEVAMIRNGLLVETTDDNDKPMMEWRYNLTHSIDGNTHVSESQIEAWAVADSLLLRAAELALLRAQCQYRDVVPEQELTLSIMLQQYSDTHDTKLIHNVTGGSGYGANSVKLEGDDLFELTEMAKYDMHKRERLAPKQLTRYRG